MGDYIKLLFCICACVFLSACKKNAETHSIDEAVSDITVQDGFMDSDAIDQDDFINKEEKDSKVQNMYINEIEIADNENLSKGNMFCLNVENYNNMTRDEILKYFDISLDLTSVLPDFYEDSDDQYGIYKFPDGSVFAQQVFIYRDEHGHTLRITICKDALPVSSVVEAYAHELTISKVLEHDVTVAHYTNKNEDDVYYAEFVLDNLGINLITENMSLDDFEKVLVYAIQMKGGL